MPLLGESLDLHQLEPAILPGHLQRVGPPAHQYVGQSSGTCLEDGARSPSRRDRIAARPVQESGERHTPSLETFDYAFVDLLGRIIEGVDHLAGRLIALPPRAETAMNHFLEMVAARQLADVAVPHRAVYVAAEEHLDELADLIHIVALLPLAHFPPGDFGRRAQRIECVGRDAAPARLVGRDPEVPQFQDLVLTDEDVERRQIAVQGLPTMQHIQRLEDGGDLVPHEFLGLPALRRQPRAQVAVLGVLHDEAVFGGRRIDLNKPVEHAERASLAREQLGEVRLPQPSRDSVADLHADARGNRSGRAGGGEIDLAKSPFADQPIQPIGPPRLIAVECGQHGAGRSWLGGARRGGASRLQARHWSCHDGPTNLQENEKCRQNRGAHDRLQVNEPRLSAYLCELSRGADSFRSRVQVAQTARSEADSGLVERLEEAERADPQGEKAGEPPQPRRIEEEEQRREHSGRHHGDDPQPQPLPLATRPDVGNQLDSTGAGAGAGPDLARLNSRDAHQVNDPPMIPRNSPIMTAPIIRVAFTNPGDRIRRSLTESVRAPWGKSRVYHSGNFVGWRCASVTAELSWSRVGRGISRNTIPQISMARTEDATTAPNSDAMRLGWRSRRLAQRATRYIPKGAPSAAPSDPTSATRQMTTPAIPLSRRTMSGLGGEEVMTEKSTHIVRHDQSG